MLLEYAVMSMIIYGIPPPIFSKELQKDGISIIIKRDGDGILLILFRYPFSH